MLVEEQQQLYSREWAPSQESKAKAARHIDAEETWRFHKFSYSNPEEQSTIYFCP